MVLFKLSHLIFSLLDGPESEIQKSYNLDHENEKEVTYQYESSKSPSNSNTPHGGCDNLEFDPKNTNNFEDCNEHHINSTFDGEQSYDVNDTSKFRRHNFLFHILH